MAGGEDAKLTRGCCRNQWGSKVLSLSSPGQSSGRDGPEGRRNPGRWASVADFGSAGSAATKRKALGAPLCGDQGRPSPGPSAFGMLLNPVTSTPFSVNDILSLEREHLSPDALQLQRTPRSPENFQYMRRVPQQPASEVPSIRSADSEDRRQEGSEPSRDPCELVTEMDARPVGEPGEYDLGSWILQGDQGVGLDHYQLAFVGDTHLLVFLAPRASPIFLHSKSQKDWALSPLYHPLQTSYRK